MKEKENFELEIIRPTVSKKEQVLWVDVEGENGNFVIGPKHSALVSILKPKGRILYKTIYNLEVEIDTFGGVIYVSSNKVAIVLDN